MPPQMLPPPAPPFPNDLNWLRLWPRANTIVCDFCRLCHRRNSHECSAKHDAHAGCLLRKKQRKINARMTPVIFRFVPQCGGSDASRCLLQPKRPRALVFRPDDALSQTIMLAGWLFSIHNCIHPATFQSKSFVRVDTACHQSFFQRRLLMESKPRRAVPPCKRGKFGAWMPCNRNRHRQSLDSNWHVE